MLDHDTRHKEGYDPPTVHDISPLPWSYDPETGFIFDANNNDVADIVGDLNTGYDTRNITIGNFIITTVNAAWDKANDEPE